MPSPDIPPQVANTNEFGNLMRWGTGHVAARSRITTLTRQELQHIGVTLEMARDWRDFYLRVSSDNPSNPSADGRADLMRYAVQLLETENE
jgi:hypothetical protein